MPAQDARIAGPGLVGAIGEALTGPLSPLRASDSPAGAASLIDSIRLLALRAVGAGLDDGTDKAGHGAAAKGDRS